MPEAAFDQARFNMIEQQVRPWDILDPRILRLIEALPRHRFVPESQQAFSYTDICIPLGHGAAMLEPRLEARLVQALDVRPIDRVLQVGTGSGYVAAMLACQAKQVISLDIQQDFLDSAAALCDQLSLANIDFRCCNFITDWRYDGEKCFDAIAITAAWDKPDQATLNALNLGGRLVYIRSAGMPMEAVLIKRTGEESWSEEVLFETSIERLQGQSEPDPFVF